jgi:hypothetical protein
MTKMRAVDVLRAQAFADLRTPNAVAILRMQIKLAFEKGLEKALTPEKVNNELSEFVSGLMPTTSSDNEHAALAAYIKAVIETEIGRREALRG